MLNLLLAHLSSSLWVKPHDLYWSCLLADSGPSPPGASNIASSFFPGLIPAFGSITRSRLNADIGARTQLSGLVTSLCIFLAIFFLLPALFFLPKCVLAAIVLLVVFGILVEAPHELYFYWKVKAGTDFAQLAGTFFLTLLVGIEVNRTAADQEDYRSHPYFYLTRPVSSLRLRSH